MEELESEVSAVTKVRKTLRRIVLAVVVLVILAGGFLGWSFYAAIYKWQSPAVVTVEIEPGMPVQTIAKTLADQGVIRTPLVFSAFVRLRGLSSELKAGEYEFPAGIAAKDVVSMMVKGEVKKYQIQIIEGWTIKDIEKYLSELTFLKNPNIASDFARLATDPAFVDSIGFQGRFSLEGYLFPDTYEVLRPKNAEELINKMVARFREIYTPECIALADKLGMTQQQIVTLASIIEKETGKADERPTIASVFYNRLKQNMALQSDPTVIYGISDFDGNLRRGDLDNGANAYNTYMHLGLPPGPISNPGKASIDAALQPANTKYLYFVSKNDGSHVFSATLEEHNRAVAQYQLGGSIAAAAPTTPESGEVAPPPGVTAIPPFVTPKGPLPVAAAPTTPPAPAAIPGPAIPSAPAVMPPTTLPPQTAPVAPIPAAPATPPSSAPVLPVAPVTPPQAMTPPPVSPPAQVAPSEAPVVPPPSVTPPPVVPRPPAASPPTGLGAPNPPSQAPIEQPAQ